MNRLNFLFHYSRPDAHEDQLTRAFLVCARLVPAVRALFAQMVRERQEALGVPSGELIGLPLAFLATGRGDRGEPLTHVQLQIPVVEVGGGPIVAVCLADAVVNARASARDSAARHDGLVAHSSAGVMVIESKLYSTLVGTKDFSPRCLPGDEARVSSQGIGIEWAELLEGLAQLVHDQCVGGTNPMLVSDFLEYAASLFPHLNPYRTLQLCGSHVGRLQRRCGLLREEIVALAGGTVSSPDHIELSGRTTERAFVQPAELRDGQFDGLWLTLYPGDLMLQARTFFRGPNPVDRTAFLGLRAHGWNIDTKFHVSFKGIHGPYGAGSLGPPQEEAFFDFWAQPTSPIDRRVTPHAAIAPVLASLVQSGILTSAEEANCASRFLNRTFMDVCACFEVWYHFPADECLSAESRGQGRLAQMILDRLNQALTVLGDSIS